MPLTEVDRLAALLPVDVAWGQEEAARLPVDVAWGQEEARRLVTAPYKVDTSVPAMISLEEAGCDGLQATRDAYADAGWYMPPYPAGVTHARQLLTMAYLM